MVIGLFTTLIVIQQLNQDNEKFRIGVVDKDRSPETQIILKSLGDGANLGKDISIKKYDQKVAEKKLENKALEGYYVFEKGMTQDFYKNGSLPISVHTYDQQSTKSLVINQLTDSVYQRLMLSMGGGLAYTTLSSHNDKDHTLMLLTDLLFTGLNRAGAFEYEPIHIYDSASYYVITTYLTSINIFALSIFTILKMNQTTALWSRLSMHHFSFEKLTLIRSLFTLFYTGLWTIFGVLWLIKSLPNQFESYNWLTIVIQLSYYVLMIIIWLTIIDLIAFKWMNYVLKSILSILIVLLSGMTIPTIYFKHSILGMVDYLPFSFVTNQMLEIVLNNYILDVPITFYSSLFISIFILVLILIGRYRL
ncbi:hypothetical protein AZH47_02345 [Corynebacterium striatum]|nr:hypothetical protein AZH47_02345 [Corynebacterium striatum]